MAVVVSVLLDPNVLDELQPLASLLPPSLAKQLTRHLAEASLVPYPLLQSISKWSRSSQGESLLHLHSLDPKSYAMISMLAGAVTSPDRKFPAYVPSKDPEELAADQKRERKAITAIINAILSVLGASFAAYWASQHAGWRNEWRVLFALFVAFVVASAEGALYLIWSSRNSTSPRSPKALHKKHEGPASRSINEKSTTSATDAVVDGLRQRVK